jgi:hypothetical protein
MLRLLTGHAISYNRRHGRHGHLFQNRYKSILCQEDAYFLELVRYIHLNPMRAGLVEDLKQLDKYPFCGHGVIMGRQKQSWQNREEVLLYFGKRLSSARPKYKEFVAKGINQGRRSDLIGGGLIRSTGGWAAVKAMQKAKIHVKSDERILGDGDFVAEILSKSEESFERGSAMKARGVDVNTIAERVAKILDMSVEDIWLEGKYKRLVTARSLLCYWAVRELGLSMASMARRLNISTVAVSKSVVRGAEIAKKMGFELF